MNRPKWNVLVFPGGTENGLEVHRALRYCKEINLFSASSAVSNHAPFVYSSHHVLPEIKDPAWIDQLNQLIRAKGIDFIFPTNAYVIDALVAKRDTIACDVILSDSDVVQTTRSKAKTAALLAEVIPSPCAYSHPDDVRSFPVFVKPDSAYGAQGALIVHSKEQLLETMRQSPDLLIQEYLPGREYSVDCFSDRKGKLLFCQGRERVRVRMGTSFSGVLAPEELNARFYVVAERILARIPLRAAWFFQVKEDSQGKLCLLEVEARIAGTMALNRIRGMNFPLLSVYDFAGHDVRVMHNTYSVSIDRALVNRYQHTVRFDVVYVDLDDTIVVKGRLNTELVRFLYQCVNEEKKIVLISKSLESDPSAYLRRWRIDSLFDLVHWLKEDESKATYITDTNSIFIDDSFKERSEVSDVHGIPTFDSSMIEMLISERE
jgi:predicted ATP-grasp superfamily ATP-dependent carboligase